MNKFLSISRRYLKLPVHYFRIIHKISIIKRWTTLTNFIRDTLGRWFIPTIESNEARITLNLVSRFLSSIFCGHGKRFRALPCIEAQLTGVTRENIFHALIATAATTPTKFHYGSNEIRPPPPPPAQFINYNNRIL